MKKLLCIICMLSIITSSAFAITMEDGRQIALEHAQLLEEDITFIEEKRDIDDGRSVFDIEFIHDHAEYDYEIDENTGEILSFDNDAGYNGELVGEVDVEQALSIALQQANLSEDEVKLGRVELQRDDGRQVYEIKFYHGRIEYECEIDASTGLILEWDRDD